MKSRIPTSEGTSAFLSWNSRVRQGESVFPSLFSIFLNNLDHCFQTSDEIDITLEFENET